MVNTTDTYWSADDESLQTYARNITTLGGRFSPPPFRGDDITVPYRAGQIWQEKVVDSRIIPLAMWVRGVGDNGMRSDTPHRKFDENWRNLRNLLWTPGRQFRLQKRFWAEGQIRTATALAEFAGGLEPTMIGRHGAKFTVDLKLADPYFYDDTESIFNLSNGDNAITLHGDTPTTALRINFQGSRTNPKLRVNSLGVEVQLNASLAGGASALLDVKASTSTTTPSGTPQFDSTGSVIHAGAPHWLAVPNGNSIIAASSSAGLGPIQLLGRGAWI